MSNTEFAGSPERVEAKTQMEEVHPKLRLDKVVIRSLTDQELGLAAGGLMHTSTLMTR